jgi:hypothetical protein
MLGFATYKTTHVKKKQKELQRPTLRRAIHLLAIEVFGCLDE